jgi:hypothetical protein
LYFRVEKEAQGATCFPIDWWMLIKIGKNCG